MSINILDVDIDNIRKAKYQAMKEHIISVLDKVKFIIEKGRYDDLEDIIFFSPEGDGYGSENYCINFAWRDNEDMDIKEVVTILEELKRDAEND